MTISLDAAAQVMREAMRETIRRHSLWYLIQSALMFLAGILALVYPVVSSVGVVFLLGWLLIISGIVQGISLVDVRKRATFLASACLGRAVGDCRRTLTPPSGRRPSHTHAPTDRVFHSRGHFESDFFVDSATISKLGLGVGERHRWDIAGFLSLGQPPNNRSGCLAYCSAYSSSAKGPLSVI